MTSLALQLAAVVIVAMVILASDADAYRSYRRRSSVRFPFSSRNSGRTSFYSRFGSGSRLSTPRARYTHGYSSHPHPHPPQAIGIPVEVDLDDLEDMKMVNKFMPYGYGDSLLAPIEGLLRDLAMYTGYRQNTIPNIVKNIKHEFYIGANNRDPTLHSILKRYGFMFTGNPLGTNTGQGGLNGIFDSFGLGGNNNGNGAYTNGLGVSSAQNPLPGVTGGINDDLFDDFGNGLLGLAAASTDTARSQKESTLPNLLMDDAESSSGGLL